MDYSNLICKKGWGKEYLIYQNDRVGLWCLEIANYASTSLHAHPHKKTGLVVLDGVVDVTFLSGKGSRLLTGEKIMIRQGVFHRTTSFSDPYATILEIECPNKKRDIIRLKDNYGREGKKFEGRDSFYKSDQNLMFYFGKKRIGQCELEMVDIENEDELLKSPYKMVIVLSGYLRFKNFVALGPGDVIGKSELNQLVTSFNFHPMKIIGVKVVE